jgi:C1A family cysteine protease
MRGLAFIALIGTAFSVSWRDELTSEQLGQLDLKTEFHDWAQEFGKTYPDLDEEVHRYSLWLSAMQDIAAENDQDLSYKLRMNQFGDWTKDEYQSMLGLKRRNGQGASEIINLPKLGEADGGADEALPSSVDWTTQGVVTPVKNQGQCGSCWAFSTTGSMECDYAIKYGTLTSLSEQQLVDCSTTNYGCSGGWYERAWQYARNDGGLCTESSYSYTARDGTCKASSCGTKYNDVTAGVYSSVTKDDDTALATAVAAGCVSVSIEADQTAFQYYSSGVLTGNCGCNTDHAVLVVGYGTESGQEYWKVKNSWGVTWGEKGYVLICRNCDKNGNRGECCINSDPAVPDY